MLFHLMEHPFSVLLNLPNFWVNASMESAGKAGGGQGHTGPVCLDTQVARIHPGPALFEMPLRVGQ